MKRTSTRVATFLFWLTFSLLGLSAQHVQAQGSQGLVADSTELRALRQLFTSTNGLQWYHRDNWPTTDAQWAQATVAQAAGWYGLGVDQGDIVYLNLDTNNLTGPLPVAVAALGGLRLVYLGANPYQPGPLPAAYGQLHEVRSLTINGAQLTGAIPAAVGQLSHLEVFNLTANSLSDSLPSSLGQLQQLQFLNLRYNQLSGAIPAALGRCANLRVLYLGYNLISGPLPASLGQLSQLAALDLSYGQLQGSVPAALGQLAQLQVLDLSVNQFTGAIPTSLGQLHALRVLSLNNNQLSGAIPAELGQLSGLQNLNLFNNQLTGPIPPALGQLHSLLYCNLFNNQLSGTIPAALGGLQQVRDLNLYANQLTGPVPAELSQLGSLQYLNLNDNHLSGNLGPALGGLGYLQHLRVFDNGFNFGDLEPLFTGANQPARASLFQYGPQLPPPGADTVHYAAWGTLRLARNLGGAHTHYQWQRLVGEQWTDVPGAQDSVLLRPAASAADWGAYRVRATNDWVVDLTLFSKPLYAVMGTMLVAGRNLPNDANKGYAFFQPHQPVDSAAAKPADMNYVRTWVPRVALRHAPDQGSAGSPGQGAATGRILREQWMGIAGTLVSDIPLTTLPSSFTYLLALEGPTNIGDEYGDRIRGYLYPPQTGSYTFWIAGDDQSELWLSTDDDPTHKVHLATVPGYTDPRQWDKYPEQQSAAITLVQGRRYYVEVLHKEGGGGDNVAVAWRLPNGTIEGPIAGSHLAPAPAPTLATAAVWREEWDQVGGTHISDIPLSTPPTSQSYLATLEGPTNIGDEYGDRMRAYLTAPQTGQYTFWIAGDDNSELWLSTDENPAHKVHLATVPGSTDPRQWDKYPEQQAAPVALVAGQRYYVEVLHKEGGGGDNVAVAWRLPDGTIEGPIVGSHLSAVPVAAPGVVLREQWNGGGAAVADIPLHTTPASTGYVATLETAPGLGDDYGAQLSGYLTAPQTGSYTFWIAGDDTAELWLSTDADSSHQVRQAYVPGSTAFRQYDSSPAQQSAPISLVAGQRYYVRVLHKQQGGGDHVSVAWQLPDTSRETPIASTHLAPAGAPLQALTAGTVAGSSWTVDSASITTQYLDGLGRPVQTVQHLAAPSKRRDLVQAQAYDGLGREPRAYLPYAADTAGTGSLGYHYQPLTEQQRFYKPSDQPGPPKPDDPALGVARTGVPFAETLFEASPLNRVVAQGAAGEAWQLTNGHVTERMERPNTDKDSVLYFRPGYDPRSLDPGYQGFYAPGELWGVEVMDPHGPAEPGAHGYKSLEWKDKLGQVVLRQVEAARAGRNDSSRWLRTAYVYDDFQRLRFVLQPEASKRVLALPQPTQPAALPAGALPYLFHYRYDGRGRQVAKQVPGQDGETLVVYDQLDRPVLSQDAQQRTRKEWSWTKYDALGRVVLTGLVTRQDTAGQVTLQNVASADTATAHQYEQRTADATFAQHVTTNQSFPKLGQQGFGAGRVLSASYYDDYDFDFDGQADADGHYSTVADGAFAAGQAPVADEARVTGLPTRTLTRVLNRPSADPGAEWLSTTTFYDERGRVIQTQGTNARGGLEVVSMQLDFLGKPVRSVARHTGPSHEPVQVVEAMTYDHAERLLRTSQQLPGEAGLVPLSRRAYNELGQLVVDSLAAGRLAQQVKYAYNIRGWLISLNNPLAPAPQDLFNLSLHYEQGFTKGYEQYNGNLTGQTWRGRDGVQRAYGYVYDPLNRLLQGDFVARTTAATPSAGAWQSELDRYRLSFVSYDDNGNINTLRRQGLLQAGTHNKAPVFGAVDNLSYAYQGNRLQSVDDQVSGNQLAKPAGYHGAPTSLAGDFQEGGVHQGQEYLYDANGNLTQDKNKGITGILYNHLNLPRQIHFGSGADSVVFRYTAGGQKVAKLVYQTGKPLARTDYLGPYQYEGDSLRFFPHAAGRVLRFVSYDAANQPRVSYQREYTLKDHLGNLRLAYRLGQVRTLTATLEQDEPTHKRESQQFDSLSVSVPIAASTSAAHSGMYAAKLNAGGSTPQPLGPLTQLGVQKGDTVTVTAFGYYPQAEQHGFLFSLASFIANLVHPAQAPPPGLEASRRKDLPLIQVGVAAGLASIPQLSNGVPQGYVRVLVFNKDSALVDQQVAQLTQAANGGYERLRLQLVLPQDGYITTYVGNESDVDVLFDDVSVEHRPGVQVQEVQYDPVGLELAGLSAPSPGIRGLNNYRFNGKEFQPDLGLNWNHQDWRFLDPQLLRWHSVDPKIENAQESWTPYTFGYDNPIRYADSNGLQGNDIIISGTKEFKQKVFNQTQSLTNNKLILLKNGQVKEADSYKGRKGSIASVGQASSATKPNGTKLINSLINSPHKLTVTQSTNNATVPTDGRGAQTPGKGSDSIIEFNPDLMQGGASSFDNKPYPVSIFGSFLKNVRPPFIGLGHELIHGLDNAQGLQISVAEPGGQMPVVNPDNGATQYLPTDEITTRSRENGLRSENELPLRLLPQPLP